jgi:kinesin family protein 6/9
MEAGDGDVQIKNLSLVSVNSEEDALNALFTGDTNRMIAETPMNMASTRSHCIFSIYVTKRERGAATFRKYVHLF